MLLSDLKSWRHAIAVALAAGASGSLAASCADFSSSDSPSTGAVDGGTEGGAATDSATDSATESATDAGARSCAARTDAPLMCADFDDAPTPLFYVSGISSPVPIVANRAVTGPGKSAPNAMWSDGRTVAASPLTIAGNAITTHVHVEMEVYVDDYAGITAEGALVRVGVAPNQCYVDVVLDVDRVLLQTHCVYTDDAADYYDYTPLLAAQLGPKKWWHLALDVDYGASKAVATLNGTVSAQLGLNPSAKPGGMPFVDIGAVSGARVGFDDILATASK